MKTIKSRLGILVSIAVACYTMALTVSYVLSPRTGDVSFFFATPLGAETYGTAIPEVDGTFVESGARGMSEPGPLPASDSALQDLYQTGTVK